MRLCFEGKEQSLEEILKSRDERVEYQQYLLNTYRSTIVSYKLNVPGPVKYNSLIKEIFDEGLRAFKQKLEKLGIETVHEKVLYKHSGPEYFGVFNILSPYLVKKITTSIEEAHPLGRVYDFDVIDVDGKQLSRQDIGIELRKCLLCDKNAFECGRSRNHEISALLAKIESMAWDYFNGPNTDYNN